MFAVSAVSTGEEIAYVSGEHRDQLAGLAHPGGQVGGDIGQQRRDHEGFGGDGESAEASPTSGARDGSGVDEEASGTVAEDVICRDLVADGAWEIKLQYDRSS